MSANSPLQTQIDLLYHAGPVGGRRYRGQTDDPLSDKAWQQIRAVVADNAGHTRIRIQGQGMVALPSWP